MKKMFLFLTALLLTPLAGLHAAAPTLSELAQPAKRSAGAPKYDDICYSPRDLGFDKPEMVDVAKTFHATRIEWLYVKESDGPMLQKFRDMGISLGLSVSGLDKTELKKGPKGFKAKPEYYTIGRALDIEGKIVEDGLGSFHDPAYNEVERNWFRLLGKFGAQRIHKDDADWKYKDWDFNPHALAQFNDYLATCSPQALQALQIGTPKSFDLKGYIRSHNDGKTVPKELKRLWEDFRIKALRSHYELQRKWAAELIGPNIEFTANHGSFIQPTPAVDWSDWPISELQPSGTYFGIGNPWSLYAKVKRFRSEGKALVVTLGSSDTQENKTMIALTYAMGAHMLTPYAVYLKNNLPRYYPNPTLYSDVYDFVHRWGKTYLAGYEEAFVQGNGMVAPLNLQGQAPLRIDDPAESAYAFVRARPGQADAPVVIHLVKWNKEAHSKLAVTLEPDRFFPGRGLKITLLRPGQEPVVLSDGWQARVEVSSPEPWAMLVVEPASAKAPQVWAAEIETEEFGFFDKRTAVLQSRTPGAEIHYTTDGSKPTQKSPRYVKPVEITKNTTLTAQVFAGSQASAISTFVFTKQPANKQHSAAASAPGLECELREGIKLSFNNDAKWEQGTYEFMKSTKSVMQTIALPLNVPVGSFALNYNGYLDVPADGLYTFHVKVADESRLYIDDAVVINKSGRSLPPDIGVVAMQGRRLLSKGLHKLRVECIYMSKPTAPSAEWRKAAEPELIVSKGAENSSLELQWQGPGLTMQPIAASCLKH